MASSKGERLAILAGQRLFVEGRVVRLLLHARRFFNWPSRVRGRLGWGGQLQVLLQGNQEFDAEDSFTRVEPVSDLLSWQ
jgi:hypothetical protein